MAFCLLGIGGRLEYGTVDGHSVWVGQQHREPGSDDVAGPPSARSPVFQGRLSDGSDDIRLGAARATLAER